MDLSLKDAQVVAVVERLRAAFGGERVAVVDNWPDDPYAVGVARPETPGVLVYFAVAGPERFFVALEGAPGPKERSEDVPYRDAGSHSDMTLDQVIGLVGQHLGLNSR